MKETFSNNLKQYRKQKQLSQEQLAEQLGITTQAVSKWECGLSYPDIDLLPQLADLFHVSIDALLRKAASPGQAAFATADDLPDDDVLRIVQYRGKTLLQKDTYDPNIRIPLSVADPDVPAMAVQIWGSADILGSINGYVVAGRSVNCSGDINGSVDAGGSVTCDGNINGPATAGENISCGGDLAGDAFCEGSNYSITCNGDIHGNASAGHNISCDGDIHGNASAGGDISCKGK